MFRKYITKRLLTPYALQNEQIKIKLINSISSNSISFLDKNDYQYNLSYYERNNSSGIIWKIWDFSQASESKQIWFHFSLTTILEKNQDTNEYCIQNETLQFNTKNYIIYLSRYTTHDCGCHFVIQKQIHRQYKTIYEFQKSYLYTNNSFEEQDLFLIDYLDEDMDVLLKNLLELEKQNTFEKTFIKK